MPNRDILPVSGVKQGLFTARPTPRLEYEVADARYNSLTPPGRVSGPTHPHLRGNERNSRSPPAHHQKINGVFGVPHLRTEAPGRDGVSSVYILRPQVVLKRSHHTRIEHLQAAPEGMSGYQQRMTGGSRHPCSVRKTIRLFATRLTNEPRNVLVRIFLQCCCTSIEIGHRWALSGEFG